MATKNSNDNDNNNKKGNNGHVNLGPVETTEQLKVELGKIPLAGRQRDTGSVGNPPPPPRSIATLQAAYGEVLMEDGKINPNWTLDHLHEGLHWSALNASPDDSIFGGLFDGDEDGDKDDGDNEIKVLKVVKSEATNAEVEVLKVVKGNVADAAGAEVEEVFEVAKEEVAKK